MITLEWIFSFFLPIALLKLNFYFFLIIFIYCSVARQNDKIAKVLD